MENKKYYVTFFVYDLRNHEVGSSLDNFNKSFSTRQEAIAYFEEMNEYLRNLTFGQMCVYVEKDTSKIVIDCRDEEDCYNMVIEIAMPEEEKEGEKL